MATENENTEKVKLVKPKNVSFNEDETQKIWTHPDGTMERIITKEGHETRQYWHSSGSYEENRADGSTIKFYANNITEYAKGSVTITIDNNGDIKIHGHNRINVDTDAHIEVGKHASIVVADMADVYAGGHVKVAATDIALQSTSGSIVLNAERDIEFRAKGGRISGHSNGVTTFTTDNGDFHVATKGKIDMNSALDTKIAAGGQANVSSQGTMKLASSGTATLNGKGSTVIAGGSIRVGSGQVGPATASFIPTNGPSPDSPKT